MLIRVERDADMALARAVAEAGLPLQLLIAPGVAAPDAPLHFACMPETSQQKDANEMALALSDVLLAPRGLNGPIVKLAGRLRKRMIEPGQTIVAASPAPDINLGLDPAYGWARRLWQLTGRIETSVLECLAFRRQGSHPGTYTRSLDKLADCVRPKPAPRTDFAASFDWKEIAPDRSDVSHAAPIVASFNAADRSAIFGASWHRDAIWVLHASAAVAVALAVVGATPHAQDSAHHSHGISFLHIAEPIALFFVIVCVAALQWSRLRERWLECRFAAEHLRIARMCLPLMLLPEALRTTERPAESALEDDKVAHCAIEFVKRAVRDQGLPRHAADMSSRTVARWLMLIIDDQRQYHENNHRKLEKAEKRLVFLATFIFSLSLTAVLIRILYQIFGLQHAATVAENSLLFTAGGPALAAALHGASTRAGIVHRAALSEETAGLLGNMKIEITALHDDNSMSENERQQELRRLAVEAAAAMETENNSWHSLMRRQHDDIPT